MEPAGGPVDGAGVSRGLDEGLVAWKPAEIGGRRDGSEVYRVEGIELSVGDRIRWTRNDAGFGLVDSRTAEVLYIGDGRVIFRLEDGRKLELGRRSYAISTMPGPRSCTSSRAAPSTVSSLPWRAELRAQLQVVTGERVAALEGIGGLKRDNSVKPRELSRWVE